MAGLRRALQVATIAAKEAPLLRWVSSHALWFDVNLVAFGWALFRLRSRKSAHGFLWLVLLAVPLCYSLGYLAATLDMDYRFLFPSTLLMQVMSASMAADRVMNQPSSTTVS